MNPFFLMPFLMIPMWLLITYVISLNGWAKMAAKYRHDEAFSGKSLGLNSMLVNGSNYRNAIFLSHNQQGIYLKPLFLFRADFHPPG
ncbi:MAG: hypothetical protein AAF206_06815 [Bacteroidota bacterium]